MGNTREDFSNKMKIRMTTYVSNLIKWEWESVNNKIKKSSWENPDVKKKGY